MQQTLEFTATITATGDLVTHTISIELEDPAHLPMAVEQILMRLGTQGLVRQEGAQTWRYYAPGDLEKITCNVYSVTLAGDGVAMRKGVVLG